MSALDRGGFAGAVGPEESEHFPFLDLEGDVIHRGVKEPNRRLQSAHIDGDPSPGCGACLIGRAHSALERVLDSGGGSDRDDSPSPDLAATTRANPRCDPWSRPSRPC